MNDMPPPPRPITAPEPWWHRYTFLSWAKGWEHKGWSGYPVRHHGWVLGAELNIGFSLTHRDGGPRYVYLAGGIGPWRYSIEWEEGH